MSESFAPARRTPLYDQHVAARARMVEFAGWAMPVQYASILDEHQAVRRAAGLFDVSHMGEVEIVGPGAESLCARLFTNDARVLVPGRAQYSMIPNEHGGVVDDIIVYRLAAERFLVCVNASNATKDLAWIHARTRPDDGAAVIDRSDETALIAVQGPAAVGIVEALSPGVRSLARFGCEERRVAGIDVVAARTGYTGEDGVELFCPASSAVKLWKALLDAGKSAGLTPCGLGARDTLRIEAALPLYGHELGEEISPYEANLGWAVKLNRDEMVGREALARVAASPPRRLIGLLVDGGIAREGAPVFAHGSQEPIGAVTSGTHSPTLGRAVAMALVSRISAPPLPAGVQTAASADFEVEIRGKRRAASVTRLPFCVKRPAS